MPIYSLISDSEIKSDLSDCFKNRALEQKFLYHGKWANLYYEYKDKKDILMNGDKKDIDIVQFWIDNCFEKWWTVTLVSLGCGNSSVERNLYSKLPPEYIIDYVWVDLSKEMLKLSEKNLKKIEAKKKFVCADFSSFEFKNEIDNLTKRNQKRIFTFFSNTFGNINHTNIIDTLYDILKSWEQIWLDVRLRKSNKLKDDMDIFNLVNVDQENQVLEDFLSNTFIWNDIPKENGAISKVMTKEEGINSLKVKFNFNFTKKTKINMKWQITFLPWESVRCLQIYYYDAKSLISFFEEHNFKLINKEIQWLRGQFLFEKK